MKRLTSRHSKKAGLPPGSLVHIGDIISGTPRITLIEYDESRIAERAIDRQLDQLTLKQAPTVSWINVDGVHDVDILRALGERFALHPLVLEDILNTEQRPKLEDYGDYLYIVVKMFSCNGQSTTIEQVSLILGKNYLLSFQEQGKPGDVFDPIRLRIRSGAGRIRKAGADFLAYSLLDVIVDNYFILLERFGDRIESLEEELIDKPTPKTINTIYRLKREMIFLRRSVWPLREVINGLQRGESTLITPSTQVYLRDVYDHTVHVIDTMETLRDVLSGMIDIYLSSISYRMNEVMKVLTIVSTVFIPLTFIVGVYGMNFEYLPELKWRWAYPALWVIMLGIAIGMLVYFKRKKWL
jgi:magnesium transporter